MLKSWLSNGHNQESSGWLAVTYFSVPLRVLPGVIIFWNLWYIERLKNLILCWDVKIRIQDTWLEETDYRDKSLGAVSTSRSFLFLLRSVSFPLRQELTYSRSSLSCCIETPVTESKINPFSLRLSIFYHGSKSINPLQTFLSYVL